MFFLQSCYAVVKARVWEGTAIPQTLNFLHLKEFSL